jgi:hypothetical protein
MPTVTNTTKRLTYSPFPFPTYRALGMKRLLERGLRCDCLRLEDCVLVRCKDPTRQLHEDYAAT